MTVELESKLKEIGNEILAVMEQLYCRWRDEHEYERIENYAAPIQPLLAKYDATLIKMYRRPFGFTFNLNGENLRYTINRRRWLIQ